MLNLRKRSEIFPPLAFVLVLVIFLYCETSNLIILERAKASDENIANSDAIDTILTEQVTSQFLGLSLRYPSDWKVEKAENETLKIYSNRSGQLETDLNPNTYNDTDFLIDIYAVAAGNDPLETAVSYTINYNKLTLRDYQLIELTRSTIGDSFSYPSYKEVSIYKAQTGPTLPLDVIVKQVVFYTIVGNKMFSIIYSTELDKFSSYSPLIQYITKSIRFTDHKDLDFENIKSGIELDGSPVDLSINPITNKLYVAVPITDQIHVLNGSSDKIITNISIGVDPNALAIDSITNRVYVTSPENDKLYIIDGFSDRIISEIQIGRIAADIAIDTFEFGGYTSVVFVANSGSDSISVLDASTGKVVKNITMETGSSPSVLAVNPVSNKLYVSTINNAISVIDYFTTVDHTLESEVSSTIPVGLFPRGLIVDHISNRIYVSNSGGNTVSVINGSTNKVEYEIPVGTFPYSMSFNPSKSKIYVANSGNNTVSIIQLSEDRFKEKEKRLLPDVRVDSVPYDITVNPNTNNIYLANFESKTISVLNGNTDNLTSVQSFFISPNQAGKIQCAGVERAVNISIRLDNQTKCGAVPNSGFIFKSWSSGLPSNSSVVLTYETFFDFFSLLFDPLPIPTTDSSKSSSHTISSHGIYTANFVSIPLIIQAVGPYLSAGTVVLVILLAVLKPTFDKIRGSSMRPGKNIPNDVNNIVLEEDDEKILSKGEIIGFDSAVITGVLFFLTISEGFESNEQTQISIITASIVFPFAISAIFAVGKHQGFAIRLMIAGFVNLMVSIILLAIMKL